MHAVPIWFNGAPRQAQEMDLILKKSDVDPRAAA
jgi:hypothetical protein